MKKQTLCTRCERRCIMLELLDKANARYGGENLVFRRQDFITWAVAMLPTYGIRSTELPTETRHSRAREKNRSIPTTLVNLRQCLRRAYQSLRSSWQRKVKVLN